MGDDNNTVCEALEDADQALQRAVTRFTRAYPDVDRAEDSVLVEIRRIRSLIEDVMADVDSR